MISYLTPFISYYIMNKNVKNIIVSISIEEWWHAISMKYFYNNGNLYRSYFIIFLSLCIYINLLLFGNQSFQTLIINLIINLNHLKTNVFKTNMRNKIYIFTW